MSTKHKRRTVALFELLVAALLIVGIWVALPARWWPVDIVGSILATVLTVAAVGLLVNSGWGRLLSIAASWLSLAVGMITVTVLAWTAAYLAGLYGPIGGGGALILGAVAVLLIPYLIGFPVIQLALLRDTSAMPNKA
jgi:hypothetical protein